MEGRNKRRRKIEVSHDDSHSSCQATTSDIPVVDQLYELPHFFKTWCYFDQEACQHGQRMRKLGMYISRDTEIILLCIVIHRVLDFVCWFESEQRKSWFEDIAEGGAGYAFLQQAFDRRSIVVNVVLCLHLDKWVLISEASPSSEWSSYGSDEVSWNAVQEHTASIDIWQWNF